MKVIVKARHMPLTEPLKNAVENRITKSITKLVGSVDGIVEIELNHLGNMTAQKNNECRVNLMMHHYQPIIITEIDENMYQAIEFAKDRLVEKIKRSKGRHCSVQPKI